MTERANRNPWRRRAIVLAGTAAGMVVAYLLFQRTGGPGMFPASVAGGSAMDGRIGEASPPRPPGIPRIDLEPHPATETAIFALG